MKIKEITAFPIRISRDDEAARDDDAANIDDGAKNEDARGTLLRRPPVIDFGDYFVDAEAFTSIYSQYHETTVIKVETDTGTVGWGEAQSPVSPRTTQTIVEDLVRPLILGRDPFDIEAIWTRNYGAMRERGHPTGFYVDAIGGTDIALWDIVGKATGKPVHKLAGGRYRDRIKLYAGMGGIDPDRVADMAEEHVGYGYQALKLHLLLDADGVAEIARAVRKRVGPGIMLMCDVHMRQSVSSAIKLGRELEKLDFTWLESPLVPEDIPGAAALADALDMAVAIGEWSRTRYEMREAFERRAYDIVMHDIARTGITEGHRIGTIADTYNIPVAPHVGGGGILSVAATVEYSASCSNFMIMEHSHHANEFKNAITSEYYGPSNGYFEVTDKPGLGIEIDQSLVEKYVVS